MNTSVNTGLVCYCGWTVLQPALDPKTLGYRSVTLNKNVPTSPARVLGLRQAVVPLQHAHSCESGQCCELGLNIYSGTWSLS